MFLFLTLQSHTLTNIIMSACIVIVCLYQLRLNTLCPGHPYPLPGLSVQTKYRNTFKQKQRYQIITLNQILTF